MEEILASIRRIIADDEPANERTESRQENVARESAAPAPPRPSAVPSHAAPSRGVPMSPPPRAEIIMDDCQVAAAVVEDEGVVLRRGDVGEAIVGIVAESR